MLHTPSCCPPGSAALPCCCSPRFLPAPPGPTQSATLLCHQHLWLPRCSIFQVPCSTACLDPACLCWRLYCRLYRPALPVLQYFLEILQNRKSDTLEWIIIILIGAEICLSLYDLASKGFA